MKYLRVFLCSANLFLAVQAHAAAVKKPKLQTLVENANFVCKISMNYDIEVFDSVKNSTVTFNFPNSKYGSCAAISFRNKKAIITAAHVVQLSPEQVANFILRKMMSQNSNAPFSLKVNKISVTGNVYFKNDPAKAIAVLPENIDASFDLTILRPADPKILEKIKAVRFCKKNIEVADSVFTIGNPRNLNFIFMSGKVSGLPTYGKIRYILTSPMVDFGNSGGPLLDENGHFIGITVQMFAGNAIPYSLFVHRDDIIIYLNKIDKK